MTPIEYLESKGIADENYMDSGMVNHIAELLEGYAWHILSEPSGTMKFLKHIYKNATGKDVDDNEANMIIHDFIHPPR